MTVHLRCDGTSRTLRGEEIDIDLSTPDEGIREALERHLDIPRHKLSHLVIDRLPSAVVVRPPAVFG
ncbi:MAG TPA: hypothetical protein VNO81_09085 [Candidatus Nitrosotenuis sp.]|jgi:hypothetical protein|nr:hypothetical protein [Candidatus Nitrosotenuis sp.]